MRYLLSILFLLVVTSAGAQWTSHLSMRSCTMSAMTDEGPIAGNSVGFFLSSNDGSLVEFTKTNHLSDIGLSAIDVAGSIVYVGYSNGNIDIVDLRDYTTVNIPEFKNYTLVEDKTINSIRHDDNYIYCSTNSGLMLINKEKREITSRYIIDGKRAPRVNASVVMGDSLYVATSTGIYRALKASRILENANEWTLCDTLNESYSDIALAGERLLLAKGAKGGTDVISVYKDGSRTPLMTVGSFRNLSCNASTAVIACYSNMYVLSIEDIAEGSTENMENWSYCRLDGERNYFAIYSANLFKDGQIVVGDGRLGMVVLFSGKNGYRVSPNGPAHNTCYKLLATKDAVLCSAGGLTDYYNNLERAIQVHCYVDGKWSTISNGKRDALTLVESKEGEIYLSTWGNGVFRLEKSEGSFVFAEHYTYENSTIRDIFGGSSYMRTNAMAFNARSSFFVAHSEIEYGIAVRNKEGEWGALSYIPMNNLHSAGKMIFTSKDHGWIILPDSGGKGLFVFSTNGTDMDDTDDVYRGNKHDEADGRDLGVIKMWDENREELAILANDIEEDKEGVIWLGTTSGLVVFRGDERVFETAYPKFERIKVPRNDGTNLADYLLEHVSINAIAVDGANRKWIGTVNDGAYLVSGDGLETIYHFTEENSPLVSNEIIDIAVSPTSGEVYFSTPRGIVSFHSDATEPAEDLDNIRVYPNPVRAGYNGSVTMNGFTDGAYVKITDINGRLLYSTRSTGGTVVWNCRNLDGEKASTGVYIVWAVSEDAKEKAVSKIAVIK